MQSVFILLSASLTGTHQKNITTCIVKPLLERQKDTPAKIERKITEIEEQDKAFEKKNGPRKRALSKVVQDFLD